MTALAAKLRPELRHAVRIVVAGSVSWQVCVLLGSGTPPVFAVIVPLVAMDEHPLSAFNVSFARLVGVVAGIGLGSLLLRFLGPGVTTTALLLTLGLGVGMVLRFGGNSNIQVAVSALLVFTSTQPGSYGVVRIWETAVGAAVTVALAPLLLPSDPARVIRARLEEVRTRLANQLAEIAALCAAPGFDALAMESLQRAGRQVQTDAAKLPDDLDRARRAIRWNPVRWYRTGELRGLTEPVVSVSELADSAHALASQLPELLRRPDLTGDWVDVSRHLSQTLLALSEACRPGAHPNTVDRAEELLENWRARRDRTGDILLRHELRRIAQALTV